MIDSRTFSRTASCAPIRGELRALLGALATLMALVWLAWQLFDFDGTWVLGVSLALATLGLLAIVIRLVLAGRDYAGDETSLEARTAVADSGLIDASSTALGGKRWSLDVFAAIDAQRFAAVCETWFSWAGFDTRTQSHRTDGGVDIWLHAARMPGPVAIVRCKHWLNRPVGLQEMKEFLGVVANFQSAHGTYTTTSTFTPEALQFALDNGIDAVDGRSLLRRIQTRTRQRQQDLLAVAYSGQN